MLRKLQASIIANLLEEQERWLLWLPVAMGCGVLLYFGLHQEPRPYAGVSALTLTLPSLWRWKGYPLLRGILLACFGMALGFSAAQFQAQRVQMEPLRRPTWIITLQGHLAQIQDTENGMKLIVENPTILPSLRGGGAEQSGLRRYARNDERKLPSRIRINLRKSDPALQAGQEIRLRAGLFPLPSPALPGGFDMTRHFYFQGIGAVGFGLAPVEEVKPAQLSGWREPLNDIRHRFSRYIRSEMPGAEGAIADALITGEQSAIPKDLREQWAVAGIAHMLSISGLHLSLVAGIMFAVIRFVLVLIPGMALRFPIKKWAAGAALLGSFAYLALAGFPVAANRSFVMVALVLTAVMLDRQVLSLRSVALAAILLLLWMPESLLGPSFQLSFAATTAIVALYEVYRRTPLSPQFFDSSLLRPWVYLVGIALTSLVAGLATTPYVILHFHQFTIYHILANLLTSPILSLLVMPLALLAICLAPLGASGWAFDLMHWGIAQMNALAIWTAGLPMAASFAPPFPLWGISCFTLGALWLCCWRQKWRLAGIPLMVVGMASLAFSELPDVVIAPFGKQVAVKTAEGYAIIKGGNRNFVAKIWAESLGVEKLLPAKEVAALRCDEAVCVFPLGHYQLVMPKTPEGAQPYCQQRNTILITDFYVDSCLRPRRKLAFIRPYEAATIWLNGLRVEHARSYVSRILYPPKPHSPAAFHRR